MFCGSCGSRNPDLNKFCRECGAKLPDRPRTLPEEQFADLQAPEPPRSVDHAKVAVLMDVAFAYHREGKLDQAINTCLEAIALNPDSTSAHSLLAVLYEEKGQFDEAVVHLRRVLELNPDSVADREKLARLLGETPLPTAAPPRRARPARNTPLLAGVAAALLVLIGALSFTMRLLRTPASETARHDTASSTPANTTFTAPNPSATIAPAPQTAGTTAAAAPLGADPFGGRGAAPAPAASTPVRSEPPALPATDGELQPLEDVRPLEPAPTRPLKVEHPRHATPIPPPPIGGGTRTAPSPAPTPTAGNPAPTAGNPAAPANPAPARPRGPIVIEPSWSQASASDAPARPPAPAPRPDPGRMVIKVSDPTPRTYYQWGLQAAGQGKYDAAVANFRKALDGTDSVTEKATIHQQMGYAYQQLGRSADAQAAYRSAISAYQEQIKQGSNTELARTGIRSSEAALRSLGM